MIKWWLRDEGHCSLVSELSCIGFRRDLSSCWFRLHRFCGLILFIFILGVTLLWNTPWTQHEIICLKLFDLGHSFPINIALSTTNSTSSLFLYRIFCKFNGYIITFQLHISIIRKCTTVATQLGATITCPCICMAVSGTLINLLLGMENEIVVRVTFLLIRLALIHCCLEFISFCSGFMQDVLMNLLLTCTWCEVDELSTVFSILGTNYEFSSILSFMKSSFRLQWIVLSNAQGRFSRFFREFLPVWQSNIIWTYHRATLTYLLNVHD